MAEFNKEDWRFEVGQVSYWNCTNKQKDNFALSITGDVVEIIKRNKQDFGTKQPEVDKYGNNVIEWVLCLQQPDGTEVRWPLRNKNCQWSIINGLKAQGLPGSHFTEVAGLNITVSTQDGNFGKENPRPFEVKINGQATEQFRGYTNNYVPAQANPVQQVQQAQQFVQQAQVQQRQAVQQAYQQPPQPPQYVDPYSDEDMFN